MTKRSFLVYCFAAKISAATSVRTRITWVNGIGYNEKHMEVEGGKISRLFGASIDYCFNPSAMIADDDMVGYLNDLRQAGTQKLGRITMEVDALVKHLKEAAAFVGKKGRVIHIAHSQGALLTFLASKQLTPLEMNRIEVIAFGGAAAVRQTPQTPFHRCINYYSLNDPLLWVVPSAEQALRSGLVINEEFCFLAPKIGDPVQDHYLLNPTYAQALSWEGQRYQRIYLSYSYRMWRFILIVLRAILHATFVRLALLASMISDRMGQCLQMLYLAFIQMIHRYVKLTVGLVLMMLGRPHQAEVSVQTNQHQEQPDGEHRTKNRRMLLSPKLA